MLVTLDHTEPVADHIISFYFKPARPIRYTAGHFIELTLPIDKPDARGRKHWFTLSTSPSEELAAITTKFPTGDAQVSTFKQTLKSLKPGDQVMMSDPMGDFVLPKDKTIPLVLIAGGIGATPFRSIIKYLHDNQEHRTIQLLYAANTLEEVAFRELFTAYGLPVTIILSTPPAGWDGQAGRLTPKKILELAPDVDKKLYFVSGPEPMVEGLVKGLQGAGVEKRRIVGDYFPNYPDNIR